MPTAKIILNIILDSPAHICQPVFLIFPLSESKLFLYLYGFMIVFLPFHLNSSFPGQRYLPFSLSSATFSSLFAVLKISPLPWGSKGTCEDCMVYLGDYLCRKPHLVHKRLQTGELQKEMSSAITRHWVTEAASFSIKSYPEEHTYIWFLNVWRHSCLWCVVRVGMQQWKELKIFLSGQKPLQTEGWFLISAAFQMPFLSFSR